MIELLTYVSPVLIPGLMIVAIITVLWFMALSEIESKPLLPFVVHILNYGILLLSLIQTLGPEPENIYKYFIVYLSTGGLILSLFVGIAHFPLYPKNTFHAWIVRLAFAYPVILGGFMSYLLLKA